MNRGTPIFRLEYDQFSFLLKFAQELHNKNGEPIPNIDAEGIEKVKSSLLTPFQTYDGRLLYKTFNKKATALFYFLVKNHCLQNGNKRMAILSLSYFIFINRRSFDISNNCLYALAKKTALSQNKEKCLSYISKILRRNIGNRTHHMAIIDGIFSHKIAKKNQIRMVLYKLKFKMYLHSHLKVK
jgi:prophage maintenance system killer protein